MCQRIIFLIWLFPHSIISFLFCKFMKEIWVLQLKRRRLGLAIYSLERCHVAASHWPKWAAKDKLGGLKRWSFVRTKPLLRPDEWLQIWTISRCFVRTNNDLRPDEWLQIRINIKVFMSGRARLIVRTNGFSLSNFMVFRPDEQWSSSGRMATDQGKYFGLSSGREMVRPDEWLDEKFYNKIS